MKIISRVLAIMFGFGVISGIVNNGSTFPFAVILMLVFIYFGWIHKSKNKDSVELKTTNLVKKTYNINWVNNMVAYDGAELLKKDFQLNNSINVPALFKDDGEVYIMIRSNTEASAKKLIDKIINENGGTENFTKGSSTGWAFPHHSDGFTIGYLTQHKVVRLNKH